MYPRRASGRFWEILAGADGHGFGLANPGDRCTAGRVIAYWLRIDILSATQLSMRSGVRYSFVTYDLVLFTFGAVGVPPVYGQDPNVQITPACSKSSCSVNGFEVGRSSKSVKGVHFYWGCSVGVKQPGYVKAICKPAHNFKKCSFVDQGCYCEFEPTVKAGGMAEVDMTVCCIGSGPCAE